jgi:xylan 1,4-beta-xylosidase
MKRRDFIKNSALAGGSLILSEDHLFGQYKSLPNEITIRPDWNRKPTLIKHSWSGLGNVDQMRWILRKDMQEQLVLCHKEIGLKHVRAVGIFDDEMWVFDKNPANYLNKEARNTKRYNWRVPYYIFDSLVAMGISPVVSTCFTPGEMKTGQQTVFATNSNITPPRDWQEWGRFVTEFVKGLVDRYGIGVVRNWYFEVWNEPNLPGFWTGGLDGYLKMYQVVYGAIKSVDASLKVGGPSTAHTVWLTDLLTFGTKNNCLPDYIIGHIYNNDSAAGDPLSPFDGPKGDQENKSPNFVAGIVRGARKLLDEASFKGEFHMNEWGLSWYPFSPVRETANEAAFIIKTMNDVSQLADYFAYWCLSDIYNQVGYGREAFHGNYGMLSLDGLRKPNYHAHQLLGKLGNQKVQVEGININEQVNAFVTKGSKKIQAIIYAFDINYVASDKPNMCKVEFHLPDNVILKTLKIFRIDSVTNNIIHHWKEMGSPAYLKNKELDDLQNHNNLSVDTGTNTKIEKTETGYRILFTMETPGVLMLHIDLK